MALDPSGTGQWYSTLPQQPPTPACVFGEVMACTGVPNDADGLDGDIRIDLANGNIYSKANGGWVLLESGGGAGNLSGSGSPIGAVTPTAIYQLYRDTDVDQYWWATGLTNADWTPIA